MKKKFAGLAALALTGALMVTFAGCDLFTGISPDTNFPYDVATDRGYEGSEESWLASLDTPSTRERRLYEEAKADGYEGSFLEFLELLGVTAADDSAAVNGALRSVVAIEALYRNGFNSQLSLSMGSGVIYSMSADSLYVVTNYHVVYSVSNRGFSKDIYLYLYGSVHTGDGRVYSRALKAEYVGGAMDYDVAVLKVDASTVVMDTTGKTHTNGAIIKDSDCAELVGANSDAITVGERVYAVGNAEGEGISVTAGVVSVAAEYIDILSADESKTLSLLEIRTDAAVNHGNSGGGLFNAAGELVGIVNARGEGDGEVGFGYAIPANLALSIAQNIIDNASSGSKGAIRATLGVRLLTEDCKSVYDAATGKYYLEEKVIVEYVEHGGKGSGAGLQVNDTVVAFAIKRGDKVVRSVYMTKRFQLTNFLFEVRLGDTLVLTVTRNGQSQPIDLEMTFGSANDFTLFY